MKHIIVVDMQCRKHLQWDKRVFEVETIVVPLYISLP